MSFEKDLERSELATRTILNEEWGRKVRRLRRELAQSLHREHNLFDDNTAESVLRAAGFGSWAEVEEWAGMGDESDD